jgi:hypothetical protein
VLWFAVWVLLVLAAGAVFFLLGRDLWRKATALTRDLGLAADRLTEVADRLTVLERPPAGRPVTYDRSAATSDPQE